MTHYSRILYSQIKTAILLLLISGQLMWHFHWQIISTTYFICNFFKSLSLGTWAIRLRRGKRHIFNIHQSNLKETHVFNIIYMWYRICIVHTNVKRIASSIVTTEIYRPVLFVFRLSARAARCQKLIKMNKQPLT